MNIYVGNLPYKISDADLRELFAAYGEVSSVSMVKDKMTGQSKGFGFVEMPEAGEAAAAIQGLNEKAVQGRNIKVNEAKPREDKPRGDRGGFRPREGGNGGAGFRPRNEGGLAVTVVVSVMIAAAIVVVVMTVAATVVVSVNANSNRFRLIATAISLSSQSRLVI